jgi:hypothetical protein
MTPAPDPVPVLDRVARRLWLARVLRRLLRSTAGVGALLAAVLLAPPLGLSLDLRGPGLLGVAAAAVALSLVPALRPVSLAAAAAVADRAGGLAERRTTAAECLGRPDPAARLVVRDAGRHAAMLDPARIARLGAGRDPWLATAAVTVTLVLWFHASPRVVPPSPDGVPAARQAEQGDEPAAGRPVAGAPTSTVSEARPKPGEALREAIRTLAAAAPLPAPPATATRGAAGGSRPATDEAKVPAGHAAIGSLAGRGREPAGPSPGKEAGSGGDAGRVRSGGVGSTSTVAGGQGAPGAGGGAGRGRTGDDGRRGAPEPAAIQGGPEAALARASVPPALRRYVLRYFERLREEPPPAPGR